MGLKEILEAKRHGVELPADGGPIPESPDAIGQQFLSPQVGQPFQRGKVAADGGASGLAGILAARGGGSQNRSQFQPTPLSVSDKDMAAFEVISSIVDAEQISPWNAAAIKNSIRLSVDTPQAAFILSSPEIIDTWQNTIYSQTMASLGTSLSEVSKTNINDPNEANARYVADFFKAWDSTFATDERKFIMNLIAAMPDARTILEDANVTNYGGGLWNQFKTGWQTITRAPEAIRPTINDPRRQMISEMNAWLEANPLETLEDKADFNMFFFDRAASSIKEVNANASGFFALAESTVSLAFTVAGNEYNDWINASADPDSFASKRNLSLGQSLAIGSGVNPGDTWYTTTSGLIDGVANIVGDPNNIAFGLGQGIKNAGRVPRLASKADTMMDAFSLFGGGRKMNLPVFDRGIISRFGYAIFSKHIDDMVEQPRALKLWDRLSGISSESEIVDLMPAWRQAEDLIEVVAKSTDPREIKEIVRNGIKHPESISNDAPVLAARTMADLHNATKFHKTNVTKWFADGGTLGGLTDGIDEIQPVVLLDDFSAQRIGGELAPTGKMTVDDLLEFAEVDVKNPRNMKDGRTSRANIDEIKASIGSSGFDSTQGGKIGVAVDPTTGQVVLNDGTHRLTALQELGRGADEIDVEIVEFAGIADVEKLSDSIYLQPRFAEPSSVLKVGELNNDGATKYVVTTLGTSGKAPIKIEAGMLEDLAAYLTDANLADDAATLVIEDVMTPTQRALESVKPGSGIPVTRAKFSRLSPEAQEKTLSWLSGKGHDFASLGDEMLVTPAGREMLYKGPDLPATDKALDSIKDSYRQLVDARELANKIHGEMDPRLWVINDPGLQALNLTKRTRLALKSKSNSTFMQGLRRTGFRMTHRYPTNISLTETSAGSQQLRNWIKALGGNDDLANKWGDLFRQSDAANRNKVIQEAIEELSVEIENPMIRRGLLQFSDKQGQYTYFYGRDGAELGLAKDGSVTPLAMAHFTDNFAMPDASEMIRSIKRYRTGQKMPATARGLLPGTRKARRAIGETLKARLARQGITDVAPDDLAAMAYADVVGGEYGRATGFGSIHKVASVFGRGYSVLHNVFVIGQLAFRPIAWSSRVLMEETVRAKLFDLPSIWSNPTRWAQDLADSMAVRKLPQRLQEQGQVADFLLNGLFDLKTGKLDINEARKLIPDLDKVFDDAGVAISDSGRSRALLGHYISQELSGQGTTAGQLGARGNITRRAIKNEKRLRNTFERMDYQGLGEAFRWDIDGRSIAQRSFWQQFVTEAEGATLPLEWSTTQMTPKGVLTYGRGYGRQIYQMASDDLIASYGFNRAIAVSTGGDITYDAQRLLKSKAWPKVKNNALKKVTGDGLQMGDLELAEWYLKQADEIVSTLFDPLALRMGADGEWSVDLAEKARILRELKNGGTTVVETNGVRHTLNADPSNYQGFVDSMANLAEGAYAEGRQLPNKIAAYLDPRFGQQVQENGFRRYTDWAMNTFGEQLTQKLHRQPAFVNIHGKYYRYYKDLGWADDLASEMASQRAAQMVNYIYFDNNNIPQFLRDMNKVIPFFSAMWEVGSTWAYKIPSHNVLPVGYMQLGRRVDRTLQGLMASGLVEYDVENNAMAMNVSWDMKNADSPLVRGFGRTLYSYMTLPAEILEYLGGVKNLVMDQEFEKGDLSAWVKDGIRISVGNPIDPTSHGLMAVNQFSVGATPLLQYPVSMGANALFAQSDQRMDVEGETSIGEFLVANPDVDLGELLRYNEDEFRTVNPEELYERALNGDIDINEIVMPEQVRIPHTSTWEMLVNRLVFPFGKMESAGEVITAASPAALNYVWRGMLQKFGGEGADEIAGMLFGQMSGYSMASELLTQIQMDEAATGSVTKIMDMASEAWSIVEKLDLEVNQDEDSAIVILDADSPEAVRAQELFNKIHADNAALVKRANDNAAGASLMRGIMGQFGPVTPRMYTRQQESVANYWASRSFSQEAEATGSTNYGKLLADSNVNSFEDMAVLGNTATAWLDDKTGDEAKVWLKQNHPALMPFIQGKSYWGPAGPPPAAQGFDKWIEQLEAGDRKPFAPEVWMARYQRAGISVDKEIAIIDRYGNDPDTAAQAILSNSDEYYTLTEDYNQRYDALDFLDEYLYEGKYAAYKRTDLDELSVLEIFDQRLRDTNEEIETMQDMLQYANLEPDERRQTIGRLRGAYRDRDAAIGMLQTLDNSDIFQNPREAVINRYYDVSNEYYEARNERFDLLATARDKTDRSIIFEQLRELDDLWYRDITKYQVQGWDGGVIQMPAPQVRSWNARNQQEKQERILNMVGKKPEWLSRFESEVLAAESSEFNNVLPVTLGERKIYSDAAEAKWEIRRAWQADPTAFTKSARDKMIREIDDEVDAALISVGRGSEVEYREMVPIMRLQETGLLPDVLAPIIPVVSATLEDLKADDKSPTTNDGYVAFMRVKSWMEEAFFPQTPGAREAFLGLGSGMFGESLPSTVYAMLLQGDYFGGELG